MEHLIGEKAIPGLRMEGRRGKRHFRSAKLCGYKRRKCRVRGKETIKAKWSVKKGLIEIEKWVVFENLEMAVIDCICGGYWYVKHSMV